jgi:hypothetical protein
MFIVNKPGIRNAVKDTALCTFPVHKFRFFNSLTAWSAARAVKAI